MDRQHITACYQFLLALLLVLPIVQAALPELGEVNALEFVYCETSSDCGSDQYCDWAFNVCGPQKSYGGICQRDSQCGSGLVCVISLSSLTASVGTCLPGPVMPEQCSVLTHCVDAFTCNVTSAYKYNGTCSLLLGVTQSCVKDSDWYQFNDGCQDRLYCSNLAPGTDLCLPRRPSGASCVDDAQCITDYCENDACWSMGVCDAANATAACYDTFNDDYGWPAFCDIPQGQTQGECLWQYVLGNECTFKEQCLSMICEATAVGGGTKYCAECSPTNSTACGPTQFCDVSTPVAFCALKEITGAYCASNDWCLSNTCINNACAVLPDGAPCISADTCLPTSFCDLNMSNRCKPLSAAAAIGYLCAVDEGCAEPGAICDVLSSTCAYPCNVELVGKSPYVCPTNWTCPEARPEQALRGCQAVQGRPCTTDWMCNGTLVCFKSSSTCQPPSPLGGPCARDIECAGSWGICVNSICVDSTPPPSPRSFPPPPSPPPLPSPPSPPPPNLFWDQFCSFDNQCPGTMKCNLIKLKCQIRGQPVGGPCARDVECGPGTGGCNPVLNTCYPQRP